LCGSEKVSGVILEFKFEFSPTAVIIKADLLKLYLISVNSVPSVALIQRIFRK
jgi:hypothetical protein